MIDYYMVQELRVALKNSVKSIKEIADELNFPTKVSWENTLKTM